MEVWGNDSCLNRFAVRGTSFKEEALGAVVAGQHVCLEPEPTNPHDPNAIQVLVFVSPQDTVHIGYVPREMCRAVSALLKGRAGSGIWNTKVVSVEGTQVYVSFESEQQVGKQAAV